MAGPKIIFITGISGSGKTTVARELVRRGYIALDSKVTKGIFNFADQDGNVAPDYRPNDTAWVCTYTWRLNLEMLNDTLVQYAHTSHIFLCGRGNIRQHWDLADKVFLLKVDSETMLERLNRADRDNLFGRDEPTQQKLVEDLELVQHALLRAGAIPIDAKQPIEKVVDDILALL